MPETSVKPPEPEPLLSPEETAEYLGVSKDHLRRLRRSGEGPAWIRVSERVVRYKLSDLQSWVEARREVGREEASGEASGGLE